MKSIALLFLMFGLVSQATHRTFSGYAEMDRFGRPHATYPSAKGDLHWQKNSLQVRKEGKPWFAFETTEDVQLTNRNQWQGKWNGFFVSVPPFAQGHTYNEKGEITFSTLPNGQKVAEITTEASDLTLVLLLESE